MIVPKVWGEELIIVNDPKVNYCGKLLKIKYQHRCSLHKHNIKDETFYINKGTVYLELGDSKSWLVKGDSVRVKPGIYHRFTGTTYAEIIEFSTFHKDEDSIRFEGKLGGKVPDDEFKKIIMEVNK